MPFYVAAHITGTAYTESLFTRLYPC